MEILALVSAYLGVWQSDMTYVGAGGCDHDFRGYDHGSKDFGDNYWVLFKDISENHVYVFTQKSVFNKSCSVLSYDSFSFSCLWWKNQR